MKRFSYLPAVEWAAIAALAVMVAVTLASTLIRFLMPGMGGIFWAEEVTRYVCIWMVFLAAGVGIRYGVHLHVDLFTARLPKPVQRVLAVVACLLTLAFEGVLVWFGTIVAISNMDQQSSSLEMPMGIVYAAIPVGGALMMYETLRVLVRTLAGDPDEHAATPTLARQVD